MEKPSKRNLFDDDSSDEGDYKPGATTQPEAVNEMEDVKIDQTPVTQEQTNDDEYQPQVEAYQPEPDYVPPTQEEYVPPVEEEYVPPVEEEYVPPVDEKAQTPGEEEYVPPVETPAEEQIVEAPKE